MPFLGSIKPHPTSARRAPPVVRRDIFRHTGQDAIDEPPPTESKIPWWRYAWWTTIALATVVAPVTSVLLVVPSPPLTAVWLALVNVGIGTALWLRGVLSMNLLERARRTRARAAALGIYAAASVCFLGSSLAVTGRNWTLQFVLSLLGAVGNWMAFVVLFNGTFRVPSGQQVAGLTQVVVLTMLWELRTYVANRALVD